METISGLIRCDIELCQRFILFDQKDNCLILDKPTAVNWFGSIETGQHFCPSCRIEILRKALAVHD